MAEYQVAERKGDHVLVLLRGAVGDDLRVDLIHDELERDYVNDGVKRIRVDISGVTMLSLEGVAALLDLWREAHRRSKVFEVENAAGQPREKLAETGVLRLLGAEG